MVLKEYYKVANYLKGEDLYFITLEYAKKLTDNYHSYMAIAKIGECSPQLITNAILYGMGIKKENAIKLCEIENVELDKSFTHSPPIAFEKDVSNLQLSEKIICGLKHNLEVKLRVMHNQLYVKELLVIVDDIIKESSYLGVIATKEKKEDFIVKSVQKRRKE
jgi:hypothetical protein